jgi:hypothetical protein
LIGVTGIKAEELFELSAELELARLPLFALSPLQAVSAIDAARSMAGITRIN